MPSFLLLHGAWGVPAEWDSVVTALQRLGHQAIVVDLPIDDVRAGLEDHAERAVQAVQHVDEPVVVVGHSAGGYVASLLPFRRPVRKLIYLAAFVPRPKEPFLSRKPGEPLTSASYGDFALASPAFRDVIIEHDDGTCVLDPSRLARFLAGSDAADLLVPLLVPFLRPHAVRTFEQPFPSDALPKVPCVYLLTGSDPVLPTSSQRIFAARLGVTPHELPGADHGIHRKRPGLLARVLAHHGAS